MGIESDNYSSGRYSDTSRAPIKLGLHEASDLDRDKGCIPENLGARRQVGDRVFYLATTGVTTVAGKLYGTDTSAKITADLANPCDAAAAGSTTIVIDNAAFSAVTTDMLAGGYFAVTNGAGEGQFRRIRKNTAASTNEVTLSLYDPLETAIDATTSDVRVLFPLWTAGGLCAATADVGFVFGVAQAIATSGQYAWYQSWGPGVVLLGEATILGEPLMHDDGATYDGGMDAWDVVTDLKGGQLAVSMGVASAAGDYGIVDLQIRP